MSDVLPGSHAGTPEPELRLVLLGTIGCGKTLSGDTLLGQRSSSSPSDSGSSPRLCQLRRGASEGRRLTVVEAPRWYWSGGHIEAGVRKETERAMELAAPGPQAFLLLVPVGQFTEVERRVPAELEEVFGEGVLKHTLVLLTCGDYLMGRGAGQYLEGEDPGLREVIDRCGGQYHTINNRRPQDREQVRELLEKVENMAQKNRGCYIRQNTLQREMEERARKGERELKEKMEEQAREREVTPNSTIERRREKEREDMGNWKEEMEKIRRKEMEERKREREDIMKRRKDREEIKRKREEEREKRREEMELREKVEEQARERERELKEKVKEQARERERELKEKVEEQARERERELKEKVKEQARERERELKEKVEEQARERERELKERVKEQARERERELKEKVKEQARERERELKEKVEEQARERERELKEKVEEQARERERELKEKVKEQARERERELKEKVEEQARERERELKEKVEEQARERERELKQRYKEEEERETVLESRHVTNTETRRYWGSRKREVTPNSAIERREEEREEMEDRVTVKPLVNCLHSTPTPEPQQQPTEPQNGGPALFTRKEGAILSQLSEVDAKPTRRVVNTLSHRINSIEEKKTPSPSSSSKSSFPVSEASPSTFPPSSSSLTPILPISPSVSSLVSRNPEPSSFPLPSSPLPSSSSSSYTSSSSSQSELRVVLLGRSGSGKSAAGNIILGREGFVSRPDITTAVTQDCQKRRTLFAGRRVAVVDTPDWFRSEHPPDVVRSQLTSCVALSAPGPHAFILCVPVDQPAQAELQALGALEKVFGPGVVRTHTLVLFTHSDRLKESGKVGVEGVEKYISSQRRDLLELVERCGDRYHVMERGSGGGEEEEEKKRRSVAELLEKVEQTVREGGGEYFSCPLFQEAEDRVKQRQKEIARERRGRGEEVERKGLNSYSMQPLRETEEEGEEEEMERTREEAEKSVSALELESLPLLSSSLLSPSFMRSVWDKVGGAGAKTLDAMKFENLPSLSSFPSLSSITPSGSFPRSVWDKMGAGEKSVSSMKLENLPSLSSSSAPSSSFLRSVWEKMGAGASKVPKLTAGGALLGGVLGVFFGGPIGGAIGATAGSVVTEVGRRKFSKTKNSAEEMDATGRIEGEILDKVLKTE